jgi:23S rRNA (uracil1939-C5)-methyltransferase
MIYLGVTFYTQSGGEDTVKPLDRGVDLTYSHPEHNIEIKTSDFFK